MLRKAAFVIGFVVGAWFGYTYALDMIQHYGIGADHFYRGENWSDFGTQAFRIVLTFGAGIICAFGAYFLINLFSRAD